MDERTLQSHTDFGYHGSMDPTDSTHLQILLILAIGFTLASFLGYLTHRAKLTSILGYLVAGYIIGPYSPGFVADMEVSEQLAELGVVLMMFSVGLQFKLHDLLKVKYIAIFGALGQTLVAAGLVTTLVYFAGWGIEAGIVLGLGVGVASTVVLIRLLSETKMLDTPQGHVAIGWLIVEDLITIIALLLLPVLASSVKGEGFSLSGLGISIATALSQFLILVLLMATIGRKAVQFIFARVMLTQSNELFILTILAMTFLIAIGSAYLFGTSIALGAFLAGMIIGETDVRHQVSTTATPLKDTFAVTFFLSIGMLFNPLAIAEHFFLFMMLLLVIFIAKPLSAFVISSIFGAPIKIKLVVALALAQIGEFSFILAEEASKLDVLPDAGYDIIVAAAFVSILLNPIVFKGLMKRSGLIW